MSEVYVFFRNPVDGMVYAFTDESVANGAGSGMVQLTPEELEAHLHPVPTQEEIFIINEAERTARIDEASRAMAPILVSLQLGDATDDETVNAKAWQAYYRALKLVDVAVTEPNWPEKPVT